MKGSLATFRIFLKLPEMHRSSRTLTEEPAAILVQSFKVFSEVEFIGTGADEIVRVG
jgi:hypothetical protein